MKATGGSLRANARRCVADGVARSVLVTRNPQSAIRNQVEVVNRQRRREIDEERWREFAGKALRAVGVKDAGATIAFVSDTRMRKLNAEFCGQRRTTDVLSFPAEQDEFEVEEGRTLGDIVISVERAERQARENNLDFETEIAQLILHGILHLCGYDHATDAGEMHRLELRLRRRLKID